jgi:colanic acid biosynthesis glycosyl transferase WcaI
MRILLVGLNYAPEVVGIAPFNTELAEYLSSLGHRVTVLTSFPYYPHWRIDPAYRGRLFQAQTINGVRVIRCPFLLPGSQATAFRRIMFDTSLALSAFLASAGVAALDLVICISPPLQLGVTAWAIARMRRARLHVHLQDIVPDAAVSVGMMSEGRAVRLSRRLESFVYRKAARISVISQGFAGNLRSKGVSEEKLTLLPNWVHSERFDAVRDSAVRAALGSPDGETLVLHTGNMGAKQGLETVIDAAARLKGERVIFALVGDGNQRPILEQRARSLELSNVRFVPLQSDYPATLAAADILVLAQRGKVVDSVAPSKLLAYMASGKPIIAAVSENSEAAQLLRAGACGVVVPPEEPDALADAIRHARHTLEAYASLGPSGRGYVAAHFDQPRILEEWRRVLELRDPGGPGSR